MPDARSHRGAHSEVAELFSRAAVPIRKFMEAL
jgi:hypothetical protein